MAVLNPSPLLRWLRAMSKDQREAFAAQVGTTPGYLYQLATKVDPDPHLRLALAIRAESLRICKRLDMPPLTLEDLLVGSPRTPDKEGG